MTTAKRRWVPIVGGAVALVVLLGIAGAALSFAWLREHTTLERDIPVARATEAFAAVARRFSDPRPAVEFDTQRRPHPATTLRTNPGEVTTLQVVAWDPDERALADVTLPMWLLRLKAGPIQLGGYVTGMDDHGVRLTADLVYRRAIETGAGTALTL